jgi:glycosyltransferase involved in cell wall biosynthesis
MTAPLVSVVVTNHNYGRFLGESLRSALSQTWPAVEVVVVDDGSTDDSRKVLRSFEGKVVAVLQDCGGQAAAAGAGLEASSGDVVIFLDADDVLLPSAAERAAVLLSAPGVAKAHWHVETIDEQGRPLGGRFPVDPLPAGDLREWLLDVGPGAVPFPPTSGNAWARAFLSRVMPVPEGAFALGLDAYLAALAPLYGRVEADQGSHSQYRLHSSSNWWGKALRERLQLDVERDELTRLHLAEHCRALGIDADPERWLEASWFRKLALTLDEIEPCVAGHTVVLVDEDQLGIDNSLSWQPRPFREHAGMYWGPPSDAAEARTELERAISEGATRLVVAWPAFWWLDYYREFFDWVGTRFGALLMTDRVHVFDITDPLR